MPLPLTYHAIIDDSRASRRGVERSPRASPAARRATDETIPPPARPACRDSRGPVRRRPRASFFFFKTHKTQTTKFFVFFFVVFVFFYPKTAYVPGARLVGAEMCF